MGRFVSVVLLSVTLLLLANELDCRVFSTHKAALKLRRTNPNPREGALARARRPGALIPMLPELIKEPYGTVNRLTAKSGIKFNPCLNSVMCRNNGECVPFGATYYCKCPAGFIGKQCEFQKDPKKCEGHKCKHGARCYGLTEPRTVMDPDLQNDVESVADIEYLEDSGVKKLSVVVHYDCVCREGYSGPFCEFWDVVHRCEENYCNNHGLVYEDEISGSEAAGNLTCKCHCEQYHSGERCEYVSPCVDFPCYNGGTCNIRTNQTTGFLEPYCDCDVKIANANNVTLEGKHCEILDIPDDDDECSNPCQHPKIAEKCIRDHDQGMAKLIETAYWKLSSNRLNRKFMEAVEKTGCAATGECVANVQHINDKNLLVPTCECADGYSGYFCTKKADASKCREMRGICRDHGECVDISTGEGFACQCHEGYRGKYCERKDPCVDNPCGVKGAECHVLTEDEAQEKDIEYACVCSMKQDVDPVSMNCTDSAYAICRSGVCGEGHCFPCDIEKKYGGGLCDEEEAQRGFRCICPSGFVGDSCRVEGNACTHDPCTNGYCLVSEEDPLKFTCNCNETGYEGDLCEIPVDACSFEGLKSCLRGTCVADNTYKRGFRCLCKEGYDGLDCDRLEVTEWGALYVKYHRYTFPATMFGVLMPLVIVVTVCQRVRVFQADNTQRKGDPENGLANTQEEAESDADSSKSDPEKEPKPKAPKIKIKPKKPKKANKPVGVFPPGGEQRIVF